MSPSTAAHRPPWQPDPPSLDGVPLEGRWSDAPGTRLRYVVAGDGPLVVLLHGFPEFWYAWRRLLPALVRAGFRVAAPDLRGYGGSDKPPAVADYRVRLLAGDVAGLLDAEGADGADVVGHDWGAGVAWTYAMAHPQRLRRLAVLNGPHPVALLRGLRNPRQALRSWYMLAMQPPTLPELALRRGDFAPLARLLQREPLVAGAFGAEDLARYREAWRQPGALTAMLHYYRAAARHRGGDVRVQPVRAASLVVWGDRDRHLLSGLATPPSGLAPGARVVHLPDASHWLHHEQPARVAALLTDHLHGG